MIKRELEKKIKETAKNIPVIAVVGPRQSGKTTLAKAAFKNFKYVSLESPSVREFAVTEPESFINQYPTPLIIDEIQYAPKLFSYIQLKCDEKNKNGMYVITGSQNFLLSEKISQSLAGRVIIFNLLPLSFNELKKAKIEYESADEYIFKGFYPRLYNSAINVSDWYDSYIQTYLERDVKNIVNVGDLITFRNFIKVCSSRVGQLVNYSHIASSVGVSYNTVKSWLSILEQSYILFHLPAYYKNFDKRIIKASKLYFYDTGLVSHLLGIKDVKMLSQSPFYGNLFETFIISELKKDIFNKKMITDLFYLRDSNAKEIDLIEDDGNIINAVEIKSSKSINPGDFKNLYNLAVDNIKSKILIYNGVESQSRKEVKVLGWKNFLMNRTK